MEKQNNKKTAQNKISWACSQNIANIILASLSLLLMVIDLCCEFYFYAKDRGAVEFKEKDVVIRQAFPDWLKPMHLCFAIIEIVSVILVLVFTSSSYVIYKKNNLWLYKDIIDRT